MNRTFIPFCIVVYIAPSDAVTTLSGLVTRQSWGSNSIEFIYDESSQPFAMRYNNTLYYYVLNVQGDVVGLLNTSGTMVATYTYDPWGKVISSSGSIASVNPLRYRGYYYDTETGFYYLQSRYYDPTIGRFINADTYATTDADNPRSTNMFAYCENDPVNRSDPSGEFYAGIMLTGAAIGMGVQLMSDMVYAMVTGQPFDECLSSVGTYAAAAVSGALSTIPGGGVFEAASEMIFTSVIQTSVDILLTPSKYDKSSPYRDVAENVVTSTASKLGEKYAPSVSDKLLQKASGKGDFVVKAAKNAGDAVNSFGGYIGNAISIALRVYNHYKGAQSK